MVSALFASLVLYAEPCSAAQRFVALPVALPAHVDLVPDLQAVAGAGDRVPGCSTDESSTDCAFVQQQVARARLIHHDIARSAPRGSATVVRGGVCVAKTLDVDRHHVRWSAGALPLGRQNSVVGPSDSIGRKPQPLPTPRLETVRVEVEGQGDVEVLLLPFGALVHTTKAVFEGLVLGPITSVSAIPDDGLRPVSARVEPMESGERVHVALEPRPEPFDLTVVGAPSPKVIVHGWSDKALAYDGEASSPMPVTVQLGHARIEGLKANNESLPRDYVVEASGAGLVGARVITAEQKKATVTLGAPAIIHLQLKRKAGPVFIDAVAFYEMGEDEADATPTECDSWGNARWGWRDVPHGKSSIEVRVAPAPRRCLFVRYSFEDNQERELKLRVPSAPGTVFLSPDLDAEVP